MHSTRLTGTRHPYMVLQRRATRNRRRQQDPHWQQVRLGREARRLDRTGPGSRRRARHSLPRSLGKEQHQRRQGILLARIRYQEALDRHGENRPDGRTQGGRGAIWRRKWRRYGWQVLLERGHGHVGDEQWAYGARHCQNTELQDVRLGMAATADTSTRRRPSRKLALKD
jgi:hypothetical protein